MGGLPTCLRVIEQTVSIHKLEGAPPFPAVGQGGDFELLRSSSLIDPNGAISFRQTKVNGPTLTSKSTTLGLGTLGVFAGMKSYAWPSVRVGPHSQ